MITLSEGIFSRSTTSLVPTWSKKKIIKLIMVIIPYSPSWHPNGASQGVVAQRAYRENLFQNWTRGERNQLKAYRAALRNCHRLLGFCWRIHQMYQRATGRNTTGRNQRVDRLGKCRRRRIHQLRTFWLKYELSSPESHVRARAFSQALASWGIFDVGILIPNFWESPPMNSAGVTSVGAAAKEEISLLALKKRWETGRLIRGMLAGIVRVGERYL